MSDGKIIICTLNFDLMLLKPDSPLKDMIPRTFVVCSGLFSTIVLDNYFTKLFFKFV